MKLNELTYAEQKHIISKLKELVAHDGWSILKQLIASEREEFILKHTAPSATFDEKIGHFNRGITHASYSFATLPDKAIVQLAGLIAFHEQVEAAKAPLPTTTPMPAPTAH